MVSSGELDQIPAIAKGVTPDRNSAIGFVARLFFENDARGQHLGVVPREVIGGQEQADPPAKLIADCRFLLRPIGTGEDDAGRPGQSFCAGGWIRTQRLLPMSMSSTRVQPSVVQ